jgi:SsrA-binding protein
VQTCAGGRQSTPNESVSHGAQSEYHVSRLNITGYNTGMAKPETPQRLIAENRRARFDYFIEERLEAGLALEGWEVKAMRAGRAQLAEAYVYIRNSEAFLIGAHIAPLNTASTHKIAIRCALVNIADRSELDHLIGAAERRAYYGAARTLLETRSC